MPAARTTSALRIVARDDTPALLRHTHEALRLGRELIDRWADSRSDLEPVPLGGDAPHLLRMDALLGELRRPIDGESSVMACIQAARFPAADEGAERAPLAPTLGTRFAPRARWTHPSGRPGGFGYDALLSASASGSEVCRVDDGTSTEALDFSRVGEQLEWLLLKVDVHDFLAATPAAPMIDVLAPRAPVAAYVVVHEDFAAPLGPAPPDAVAECRFGYAFLPCACHRDPLGFGPGHFGAGIQQFRFSLLPGGKLEAELTFIVAPRSKKILDLGGFDPVYGGVRALHALTGGALGIGPRMHDAFDRYFLSIHGRVHHDLLVRMKDLWTERRWVPG